MASEPSRFHAAHLPPPETVTRLVAQVEKSKSPPLLVGGPVQVTFAETVGTDAQLGAPLIPALDVSLGGQRARSREIRCTAYGAIDPVVRIGTLTPSDSLFEVHVVRALEETAVRFGVSPYLLTEEWASRLGAFGDVPGGRGEPIEVVMEEGKTVELGLRVDAGPSRRLPLVVAVYDENDQLTSASELGVLLSD